MKTLKRALSLVLTFVICVISIDVRAFATETETNSKENLYDFEVNTYGFEKYEKRIEQNRSGEDKKFKKMNLTSTILLIIALIIAVILVASGAETISIITSVAAAIVCVIQKIVVGGFHRKGFAK